VNGNAATRHRAFARGLLAVVIATVGLVGLAPPQRAAALSAWTGSVDLYRAGTFTTQKTWLWCTAADVQIVRNIVEREADHSRASQQRYFDWMRAHNRYAIPVSDGVDPAGWAAGFRRFVDDRYRLTQSRSFDAALRSAVTSLRRTSLPVGITVAHGTHAWIVTGFSATADPATTRTFRVTNVRVVGPLWGLQSRTYGYDMRPGTSLTPKQLAGFFTPWHYGGVRMAWEGRWVSIQPSAEAAPTPPAATPPPSPASSSTPNSIAPSVAPSVAPSLPSASISATQSAEEAPATPTSTPNATPVVGRTADAHPVLLAAAAIAVSAMLALGVVRWRRRRTAG
jgi:hypothetical protein